MAISTKKLWILAILTLAITLWNCTANGDTVTVGNDELSDVQVVDDSIFDEPDDEEDDDDEEAEEAEKSSSSKADKKDKSSSSKKASAKSSSSNDSEDDEDDVSSSSSAKSSSSARKIRVPGVEDQKASSSSKGKSSSSKAKSSSSEEEDDIPSLTEIDSAAFKAMDKFSSSMQKDIEKLVKMEDSFIYKSKSTEIDLSTLDFDQNEYLCKAKDGNWYSITEKTVESIMEAIFHKTNIKITSEYIFNFSNLCDAIYIGAIETE